MKTKILMLWALLCLCISAHSQTTAEAPTLSAGLDNVAFKKGTLDVETLRKIIVEKQKELVREGIKRMVFDKIAKNAELDFYSQLYMERVVNILFSETNFQVITKKVLEETTNYLFVLGMTEYLLQKEHNTNSKRRRSNYLFEILDFISPSEKQSITSFDKKVHREQIIYLIYSLLKDIPQVKELGLLNHFNYLEINLTTNKDPRLRNAKELIDLITSENKGGIAKIIVRFIEEFKKSTKNTTEEFLDEDIKKLISHLKSQPNDIKKLSQTLSKVELTKAKIAIKFHEYKSSMDSINEIESLDGEKHFWGDYNINFIAKKLMTDTTQNNFEFTEKELERRKDSLKKAYETTLKNLLNNKNKIVVNYNVYKFLHYYHKIDNYKKYYKKLREVIEKLFTNTDKIKYILELTNLGKKAYGDLIKDLKSNLKNKFNINELVFELKDGNESIFKQHKALLELLSHDYEQTLSTLSLPNSPNDAVTSLINIQVNNGLSMSQLEKQLKIINEFLSQKAQYIRISQEAIDIEKLLLSKYSKTDTTQFTINSSINQKFNTDNGMLAFVQADTDVELSKEVLEKIQELFKEYRLFKSALEKIEASSSEVQKISATYNLYKKLTNYTVNESDYENTLIDKDPLIIDMFKDTGNFNISLLKKYYVIDSTSAINSLASLRQIKPMLNDSITQVFNLSIQNFVKEKLAPIQAFNKQKFKILLQKTTNNFQDLKNKVLVQLLGYSNNKQKLFGVIRQSLNKIKFSGIESKLTTHQQEVLSKFYKIIFDINFNNNTETFRIFKQLNDNKLLSELHLIASLGIENSNIEDSDKNNLKNIINSVEFIFNSYIYEETEQINDNYLFNNDDSTPEFIDFIKFMGNIKEMNKAETFGFLLRTFNKYEHLLDRGPNSKIVMDIINALRTYSIINFENNSIEIDAASVLANLTEKHYQGSNWGFYATVGLNQFWVPNGFTGNDGKTYTQFNAASEKIGVRYKFIDWDKKQLYKDKIIGDYKRKSYVSNFYGMIYASGILYKITDTSGRGYNKVNLGFATGLTFFNALDFNVSISIPLEGVPLKDHVIGFSFDIPLSEYLKKL